MGATVAALRGAQPAVEVGSLLLARGGEKPACTAALIAPRVALSAAHCARPALVNRVELAGAAPPVGIVEHVAHPGYKLPLREHDVGLYLLAETIQSPPMPLLGRPLDASWVGREVHLEGYAHGSADAAPRIEAERRRAWGRIAEVEAWRFRIDGVNAGVCPGDSGAPVLVRVDGRDYLAGVISEGQATCADEAWVTRVDPYLERFIKPWLVRAAREDTALGERCFVDDNCASRVCRRAASADETERGVSTPRYCSAACSDEGAGTCPDGMACVGGSCSWPGPLPGSYGQPCAGDTDCHSGLCLSAIDGRPGICTRNCAFEGATFCAAGYRCGATSRDTVAEACVEMDSGGGCSAGRAVGPRDALWLLLPLAAAALRRRRRR